MTAEEMEVAYCKGRRASMRSITRWLKEHAETAREALDLKMPPEHVLQLTINAMEFAARQLDDELSKGVEFISDPEEPVKTDK